MLSLQALAPGLIYPCILDLEMPGIHVKIVAFQAKCGQSKGQRAQVSSLRDFWNNFRPVSITLGYSAENSRAHFIRGDDRQIMSYCWRGAGKGPERGISRPTLPLC
jgi:hypothetical protein